MHITLTKPGGKRMSKTHAEVLKLALSVLMLFSVVSCKEEGGSLSGFNTTSGSFQPGGSGGSGSNQGSGQGEGGNIGGGGNTGGGSDGGNLFGFVTDEFLQDSYTEFYDFLWVVDNSGSMSNIRAFMAQNLTNFVSILESRQTLDWQMAVTITDNRDYAGNLVSSSGGVRVVNKQLANPASVWASIISRIPSTSHSGWEQGLESGYSAINSYANEFSRPNVPLIISYVSDEQDYSCQSNCNNFSGAPENLTGWVPFPTSRYAGQFAWLQSSQGTGVTVYPIVHRVPLGEECDDDYGSVGGRYMEVRDLVGTGQTLSLCQDKLEESFNTVAQLTAMQGVCFTLLQEIVTTDGMIVTLDNVEVPISSTNGYLYEDDNHSVCFNGDAIPGNGSIVRVTYHAK